MEVVFHTVIFFYNEKTVYIKKLLLPILFPKVREINIQEEGALSLELSSY